MKDLTEKEQEIVKIEIELIQGAFNKYDDLIFRNRRWLTTLWATAVGTGFTVDSPFLILMGVIVSVAFYFLEAMLRYNSVFRFVKRYRTLRGKLNPELSDRGDDDLTLNEFPVYDLTSHFLREEMAEEEKKKYNKERRKDSFWRKDSLVFYGVMAALALLAAILSVTVTLQSFG